MPIAQGRLETLQICKLLQCVRDEDRTQIEKLTVNGIPHLINYNEPTDGETALNTAACANNDSMIEFLLDLGAHPDVVDFKGRSAAMRAASYGHVQCLEKLARAKADMKLKDLDGRGILFHCLASSTQRHTKCMEIALAFGAEVNNKDNSGKPVFYSACETASENEAMCHMLLQKGADPNSAHESTNKTALMAASASGSVGAVRAILAAGGDVDTVDRFKSHAAHDAARGGFFDVLVMLAAYGANFDQTDKDGNTPIHLAANGHALCCRFLGQRGGNPKPKNNEGNPAKNIAKDNGHKDCLKELKKAERSYGKAGKNNDPWAISLYDWVQGRQEEVKEMFYKFDPDRTGIINKLDFVDALQGLNAPLPEDESKKLIMSHDKNKDGNIDYAEFIGGKKYINKLYLMSAYDGKKKKKKGGKGKKKKGKTKIPVPICLMDEGPRTAGGGPPELFIPRHIHFTDTGRFDRDKPPEHPLKDDSAWYLHHPERMYTNINDAAKIGDMDSLKAAFSRGTPVDTRDKYYKTPLMTACTHGNIKVAIYLVEMGADIHARDNFKWTPLHHACHSGIIDLVMYLVEHGADIDAVAMNGGTPLTRAIESSRLDVVQYMISKNAKMQVENRKGNTPMDCATSWADPRVTEAVKTKWDTLAPKDDKKKKGGKGGKGSPKAKRPTSSGESKNGASPNKMPPILSPNDPDDDMPVRTRKGSILRAASALAGGIEEKEDISYVPLKAWTKQPTTEELINNKCTRRDRFGWEVDFEDFQMPFKKNYMEQALAMGGDDD